ncbi:glyoxalase/bleomycin resistance/dioxygenase family protein [Bacillus sp. M6-12]|uniref:VOC family protein n=1 Tax=Bacillus sp. M6-12 TaxID=2054166 RepID=UPI000C767995|nr:VOC family protein [Bacillus sp. M6-12]PLS15364.1 glyoxalase/bleomycin resistance/dioxygenase family protein [Bacillus sp. M6-12]
MQLHHVALEVKDLEKSVDFYTNSLGFKVDTSLVWSGQKISFLALGDFRLELIEQTDEGEISDRSHICFKVDAIEPIVSRLGESAVDEGPYMLENGWRIIFCKGTDGEILEFLEEA